MLDNSLDNSNHGHKLYEIATGIGSLSDRFIEIGYKKRINDSLINKISSKDMEGTAYEVDFYLKTKDGRTQDITKTGDQFEVLGIVYNGCVYL